jgi:hypothetical protein
MLNFNKAASFAVTCAALATAAIYADSSFAYDAANPDITNVDPIVVNTAVLAADLETASVATAPDARVTIQNNGDVIYVSGSGDVQPMPLPIDNDQNAEVDSEQTSTFEQPTKAGSLAELVSLQNTSVALSKEQRCLAGAVFFESKGESLAGQLAVAKVVIARSKSDRFPSTLCGVVYQKSQFSFIRGGRMPAINTSSAAWKNAVAISHIALNNSWKSSVEGALFFHARYVSPGWKLKRMATIDNHIFYR